MYDTILESLIDITRENLSPKIFNKINNEYIMKDEILNYIKGVVENINENHIKVNDAFIKGSILSFQWHDKVDVDLLIETDEDISDNDLKRIQNEVDDEFGKNIPGTEHPLQIYILKGKYDQKNADGVYSLENKWIKGPYNISINVDDYIGKFRKEVNSVDISTGELKRHLIDYERLKSLPQDEIVDIKKRIEEIYDKIHNEVEDIVFKFKHIKNMRKKSFEEDMSPQEIAKYGTKNALPENVIFKLMERYYYLHWMSMLRDLIKSGNEIDTDEEVGKVKDIIRKEQK